MRTCDVLGAVLVFERQPPPQALRFSQGRGEHETRVTGDEPQGTMGRVQTAGEALSPSRLPLPAHRKRDVWVRGSLRGLRENGVALFVASLLYTLDVGRQLLLA